MPNTPSLQVNITYTNLHVPAYHPKPSVRKQFFSFVISLNSSQSKVDYSASN